MSLLLSRNGQNFVLICTAGLIDYSLTNVLTLQCVGGTKFYSFLYILLYSTENVWVEDGVEWNLLTTTILNKNLSDIPQCEKKTCFLWNDWSASFCVQQVEDELSSPVVLFKFGQELSAGKGHTHPFSI